MLCHQRFPLTCHLIGLMYFVFDALGCATQKITKALALFSLTDYTDRVLTEQRKPSIGILELLSLTPTILFHVQYE